MIRTQTSNTRNIIGHQIASLLAITKNIRDILGEGQTAAVGIIASKNHMILVITRSDDVMAASPAGSARLVAGANVRDDKDLPGPGVIATVTTLLWQQWSQSWYF